MERINNILRRLPKEDGDGEPRDNEELSPECPRCHGAGWLYDADRHITIPCECLVAASAIRHQERLREWSNLPQGTEDLTFTNFKRKGPSIQNALTTAKAFADGKLEARWLIMQGERGLGKTHLAIAIVRHRLTAGDPVNWGKYVHAPELLDDLRSTFGEETRENYQTVFSRYKDVPLLVLDDLGVEKWSPWVEEKLDQLFDWRWLRRLETVVTTNCKLTEFPGRIQDRLDDRRPGRSTVCVLTGKSYRQGK